MGGSAGGYAPAESIEVSAFDPHHGRAEAKGWEQALRDLVADRAVADTAVLGGLCYRKLAMGGSGLCAHDHSSGDARVGDGRNGSLPRHH